MKKIKTITCHDVYNHGASLQAYALQRYLTGQGHEVEIIDYKPWYLSNHYNFLAINNPIYDLFLIRNLYQLAKLPGRLISLKRKHAFDQFREEQLSLTPKRYASIEELKANCPDADIYIAGSDQIWNTIFQNGRDAAFYLDFVPEGKKRISYAASFATEKIVEGYKDFVKEKINQLDSISVRERTGLEILHGLGIYRAIQVCDPVFLLKAEQWGELANKIYDEKYLLVYDTEKKSEVLKQIACALAKKLNLVIYSIGSFRLSYAKRNFYLSGPIEFVSLIKNAEYIVSNSFHGTAFSIIFEKNMCVVNRSEAINSRMQGILKDLEIGNRLVGSGFKVEDLIEPIDYSIINMSLSTQIESSKLFLNNAID